VTSVGPQSVGSAITVRRAFVVIGLLAAILVAGGTSIGGYVGPVAGATFAAIVLAALVILWSRESDPFEPIAYSAFYLIYGHLGVLAALLTTGEGALPRLPLGSADRSRLAVAALTLNILAFGAYAIGYTIRRRREARERQEPPEPAYDRQWSFSRLWVVTAVCTLVFVVSYGVFQSRLGLPLFSLDTMREGKAVWRDDPSSSWMLRGIHFIFVPIALWAAHIFRNGTRASTTAILAVAIFAAFLLTRLGQRSMGAFPLLAVIGIFHYLQRRVGWLVLLAAMVAMIEFTNVSSRIRTGEVEGFTDAFAVSSSTPLAALSEHEAERGRLDSTAIILYFFPDRVDFLLGESWRPVLVLLVPRWLDPDKSRGLEWSDSRLLTTLVGFPTPTPLPAVLYANFAYFGVVLGMLLYGYFHGSLYSWLQRGDRDPSRALLYMFVLIFFAPTSAGFASAIQYVVPGFLTLRFIETRTRRDDVAPSRIATPWSRPVSDVSMERLQR